MAAHNGHDEHGHGEGMANGEHGHDHGDLLDDLLDHLGPVLDNATEGVYLWLDEETMACNEALAELFGCTVEEWCGTEDFLGDYVDPKDHELFGESFERAIGRLEGPVRFRFTGLRKDGSKVKLETDMIPLTFAGHAVAYHFVRKA